MDNREFEPKHLVATSVDEPIVFPANADTPHRPAADEHTIDPGEIKAQRAALLTAEEESTLRKRAQVRRRSIAVGYFVYSIVIGTLFATSYIFIFHITEVNFLVFNIDRTVFIYFVSISMLYIAGRNIWSYVEQKINWRYAVKEAQNLASADQVIDGFSSLFRRYVKSRSIGIHGYFWSAWGFLSIASYVGSGTIVEGDIQTIIPAGILVFLTSLNLFFSYRISNDFRLGVVLVDFLGIIAFRGAHPYHSTEAEPSTRNIAKRYRFERYWWFY